MTVNIHLHIGEPKSGTTYLQGMLKENRQVLETAGLMTPGQREQVMAAQDAIRGKSGGALWQELADKLARWQGSDALVSMETLCRAKRPAIQKAVSAFDEAPTRIHITVRDLLRSLPAQWQQSTQHRKTWSWSDYSNAVVSDDSDNPAHGNFWSQHNLQEIIDRWLPVVGAEQVYVITVPQSGADPLLLWQRFSQALGLPAVDVTTVSPTNESLGATSAELLRRLNVELEPLELSEKQYNTTVRGLLARSVLAERRSIEPKVTVPPTALGWAEKESNRLIEAVRSAGVNVVGDLDELRPRPDSIGSESTEPTDAEVAEAAIDAVRGLVHSIANGR